MAAMILPKFLRRRLAHKGEKGIKTDPAQKRRWRLLQVESSLACNLRCVMCPWREISKEAETRGIMSQEVWEAIRPYLSEVISIDFSGGGEPLLQPRLQEWIRQAKGAGCGMHQRKCARGSGTGQSQWREYGH